MNDHHAFDPNIPVLTEEFGEEESLRAPPPPAPAPERGAVLQQRAIDTWTEPEWTLMERRVSERVLNQLHDRVDSALEQHLRDSMEEVLHSAIAALTSEIRWGLQQSIETIVVHAVAQEVAHLQGLKK